MFAVTLAASILLGSPWLVAQGPMSQYGRKPASNKGPRALGLIQLSPKGKARLTPIAIMMDGKFYDAGSYKAAPVPMALDFDIVYEGFVTIIRVPEWSFLAFPSNLLTATQTKRCHFRAIAFM